MSAPNDRPDNTPDRILIDAALHYSRRTAGQGLRQITLTLADGSKRKIEVPATAEVWPPAAGWAVKGDRGAWNGTAFKLSGKTLDVFRALVDAGDGGIELGTLKRAVWDQFAEDRTVQNAVSKLRQAIKDALHLADDVEPIESGDRYKLLSVG